MMHLLRQLKQFQDLIMKKIWLIKLHPSHKKYHEEGLVENFLVKKDKNIYYVRKI